MAFLKKHSNNNAYYTGMYKCSLAEVQTLKLILHEWACVCVVFETSQHNRLFHKHHPLLQQFNCMN